MDKNFKPKKNEAILEKGAEPEAVLYNAETSSVHIVNKTAFQIWKLSDGRHTVFDIENKIKKEYNLPEDLSIFNDIETTLVEFKTRGLIL